jgi:GAF domain-containing protein
VSGSAVAPESSSEFIQLFHKLNNQLGIILANAELLESRLTDTTHRARAGQVAASALDAIATAQELRRLMGPVSL